MGTAAQFRVGEADLTLDVAEGPSLAHFDVRGAASSCLKLRDERTQRKHLKFASDLCSRQPRQVLTLRHRCAKGWLR